MDPVEQRIEVESPGAGDDDLPIHHAPLGKRGTEWFEQLWKVASHRPLVAATQLHLRTVAEHDGAEPIPLRLVDDVAGGRQLPDEAREHRRDRRMDGERHRSTASTRVATFCPAWTMYVARTVAPTEKACRLVPRESHFVRASVCSVCTGPDSGRTSISVLPVVTSTPSTWSPAVISFRFWVVPSRPCLAESAAPAAAPRAWSAASRAFAAASSAEALA